MMKIAFSKIIQGVFQYSPDCYEDSRGHFFESYNQERLRNALAKEGLTLPLFVQENQSFSKAGVLRGLHFQRGVHAQGKLVGVVTGHVIDVAVDLRPNSPTYLQHQKFILEESNQKFVYLPPGLAHGFYALRDTIFQYKCTRPYCKDAENGIRFDDPTLAIDWELVGDPIISDKDRILPHLTR